MSQIILGGASAVDWCTLVTTLHFSYTLPQQTSSIPRPKAILLLCPMIDLGGKWVKNVFLPGATSDPAIAQQLLLEEIPRRIHRGYISVGEDFPTSEEEFRMMERLPLLYAVLESGVFVDFF